jgi:hypothetical protein
MIARIETKYERFYEENSVSLVHTIIKNVEEEVYSILEQPSMTKTWDQDGSEENINLNQNIVFKSKHCITVGTFFRYPL